MDAMVWKSSVRAVGSSVLAFGLCSLRCGQTARLMRVIAFSTLLRTWLVLTPSSGARRTCVLPSLLRNVAAPLFFFRSFCSLFYLYSHRSVGRFRSHKVFSIVFIGSTHTCTHTHSFCAFPHLRTRGTLRARILPTPAEYLPPLHLFCRPAVCHTAACLLGLPYAARTRPRTTPLRTPSLSRLLCLRCAAFRLW